MIKVSFWGTRGSLPVSMNATQIEEKLLCVLPKFLHEFKDKASPDKAAILAWLKAHIPFAHRGTYGTSTPCVQIETGNKAEYLFCDAGTGLRNALEHYKKTSPKGFHFPATFHFLISHFHWDHIQALPFFEPLYRAGNQIIFHGYHAHLADIISKQLKAPFFPVDAKDLEAKISFNTYKSGESFECCGFEVAAFEQKHPGASYTYRLKKAGKQIIYATDCEYAVDEGLEDHPFLDFIDSSDLLIFDSQYTFFEALETRYNWGHSSNITAVEFASRAGVAQLVLFHTEPTASDILLDQYLKNTHVYQNLYKEGRPLQNQAILAYDGLSLSI